MILQQESSHNSNNQIQIPFGTPNNIHKITKLKSKLIYHCKCGKQLQKNNIMPINHQCTLLTFHIRNSKQSIHNSQNNSLLYQSNKYQPITNLSQSTKAIFQLHSSNLTKPFNQIKKLTFQQLQTDRKRVFLQNIATQTVQILNFALMKKKINNLNFSQKRKNQYFKQLNHIYSRFNINYKFSFLKISQKGTLNSSSSLSKLNVFKNKQKKTQNINQMQVQQQKSNQKQTLNYIRDQMENYLNQVFCQQNILLKPNSQLLRKKKNTSFIKEKRKTINKQKQKYKMRQKKQQTEKLLQKQKLNSKPIRKQQSKQKEKVFNKHNKKLKNGFISQRQKSQQFNNKEMIDQNSHVSQNLNDDFNDIFDSNGNLKQDIQDLNNQFNSEKINRSGNLKQDLKDKKSMKTLNKNQQNNKFFEKLNDQGMKFQCRNQSKHSNKNEKSEVIQFDKQKKQEKRKQNIILKQVQQKDQRLQKLSKKSQQKQLSNINNINTNNNIPIKITSFNKYCKPVMNIQIIKSNFKNKLAKMITDQRIQRIQNQINERTKQKQKQKQKNISYLRNSSIQVIEILDDQ